MNDIEIKQRLEELGLGSRAEKIMKDVSEIILARIMLDYFNSLNEEQKKTLNSLDVADVVSYIKQNQKKFPKFNKESSEKVYNEVWNDYFNKVKI